MNLLVRHLVLFTSILGISAVIEPDTSSAAGVTSAAAVDATKLPKPAQLTPAKTIDLRSGSRASYVMGLSFSPDGRYLGIVEKLPNGLNAIDVWDVRENRRQSRIEVPLNYSDFPGVALTWTPDSKYITFGYRSRTQLIQFWDPISGAPAKEAPASVFAYRLHFNGDGSKALAENNPLARSSVFRVYDTADWSFREIDEMDLDVRALSWVGDDQVLVFGSVHRREDMTGASDHPQSPVLKANDAVVRLVDLSGKIPSRTVLVVASKPRVMESNGTSHTWYEDQVIGGYFLLPNSDSSKVLAGYGNVIDTELMKVMTYASTEDLVTHKFPGQMGDRNAAISPDGARIYLKDATQPRSGAPQNVVLDANTGAVVHSFNGGSVGIAISPDGRQLAIGDGSKVQLLHIE